MKRIKWGMRRRVQDSPQHVTELNHPQESLCYAIGGLLPRQLYRGHQQRPPLLHRLTPRSQGGMLCPAETQQKRTITSRQETWPRPHSHEPQTAPALPKIHQSNREDAQQSCSFKASQNFYLFLKHCRNIEIDQKGFK